MKRPNYLFFFLLLSMFVLPTANTYAGGSSMSIYETNVRDKYLIAGQADQLILSFTVSGGYLTVNSLDITCAPAHGFTTLKLMLGNTLIDQTTFAPTNTVGNQTAHFGASDFVIPGGPPVELSLLATVASHTKDFMTACAVDEFRVTEPTGGRTFGSEAQNNHFIGINRLIYIDDLSSENRNPDFDIFDATVWPFDLPVGSTNNLLMDFDFIASRDIEIKDLFIYCNPGSIFQNYRLTVDGRSVSPIAMQNDWSTNSRPEHSTADRIVFSGISTITGDDHQIHFKLYGDTYNYFGYLPDRQIACSIIDLNSSVYQTKLAEVTTYEKSLVTTPSTSLTNRLLGNILLQVESSGQAWYLDPASAQKYYLPDGDVAYAALRNFGLGTSDADLAKIPVGIEKRFNDSDADQDGLADKLEEGLKTNPAKSDTDGDGLSDGAEIINGTNPLGAGLLPRDNRLITRVKGRILIQAESRGEAWYVNPRDGKRYYMTNGDAAYQIMRFLSLGITNSDIRKIQVGSLE